MRIGGTLDLERNVLVTERGVIVLEKFDLNFPAYVWETKSHCTLGDLLTGNYDKRELDLLPGTNHGYWFCW